MPINTPKHGHDNAPGSWNGFLRGLTGAFRASAFTVLGAVAGCADAPSSPGVTANVVQVANQKKGEIERTASTSYIAEPSATFDVGIALPERAAEPTLAAIGGGTERELARVGTSAADGIRSSSYRVAPPEGGWTAKHNGEHRVVAKTANGETVITAFTVNIQDAQPGNSVRLARASDAGGTHRFSLRFRAGAGSKIDATRLAGSGVVLRAKGVRDMPLRLEIGRDLADAAEIAIDAIARNVPAGTYDVVLLHDVPAGEGSIAKGAIATVRVP